MWRRRRQQLYLLGIFALVASVLGWSRPVSVRRRSVRTTMHGDISWRFCSSPRMVDTILSLLSRATDPNRKVSFSSSLDVCMKKFDNTEDGWDDTAVFAAATDTSKNDIDIHTALSQRIQNLQEGIGKRYICRTQRGFLNIHADPGDPFDTDNIVGRLSEGQIVTSVAPARGPWIRHDAGGWSISVYEGFVWLEAIPE